MVRFSIRVTYSGAVDECNGDFTPTIAEMTAMSSAFIDLILVRT